MSNEIKPFLFLGGVLFFFWFIARELDPDGFGLTLLVIAVTGIIIYAAVNWKDK